MYLLWCMLTTRLVMKVLGFRRTTLIMFGRHPRLAVDASLGIKPGNESSDKSKYVSSLKKRLDFAYKTASK